MKFIFEIKLKFLLITNSATVTQVCINVQFYHNFKNNAMLKALSATAYEPFALQSFTSLI